MRIVLLRAREMPPRRRKRTGAFTHIADVFLDKSCPPCSQCIGVPVYRGQRVVGWIPGGRSPSRRFLGRRRLVRGGRLAPLRNAHVLLGHFLVAHWHRALFERGVRRADALSPPIGARTRIAADRSAVSVARTRYRRRSDLTPSSTLQCPFSRSSITLLSTYTPRLNSIWAGIEFALHYRAIIYHAHAQNLDSTGAQNSNA